MTRGAWEIYKPKVQAQRWREMGINIMTYNVGKHWYCNEKGLKVWEKSIKRHGSGIGFVAYS